MKNGILGLAAVAALSLGGMAFAAEEKAQEMKETRPAAAAPAMQEKTTEAAAPAKESSVSGEKLKDMDIRPKDLDLRHCLDEKDNNAIAKCAGE